MGSRIKKLLLKFGLYGSLNSSKYSNYLILFDPNYYKSQTDLNTEKIDKLFLHYINYGWELGLNPHPLFDSSFYINQNPDVKTSGINPLVHFVTSGGSELRNPHPLFDSSFYINQNPDVKTSGINPLVHFVTSGGSELRNPYPLFDSSFYINQNPDVKTSGINPLVHFVTSGGSELRNPHPLFDSSFYIKQNPDVKTSGINPLVHFVTSGGSELRNPYPLFDSSFYINQNPDVKTSGINPLVHFVTSGGSELRNPHPLFDSSFYINQNPDVKTSGINPLVHFTSGGIELKNPHPLFDSSFYIKQNPDVKTSGINPLVHFVTSGGSELRNPHPLFDSEFYINPDIKATGVNPLIHFITSNESELRSPHPLFDFSFYINKNPDVRISAINPLIHFIKHGGNELRNPHPLFDSSFYVNKNPGVRKSGINPLIHYIMHGVSEFKSPHPLFDIEFYINKNPDIRTSGVNPLIHFITNEGKEFKSPHPLFDSKFYINKNPDVGKSGINPLIHFIIYGASEFRSPHPLFNVEFYLKQNSDVRASGDNPLIHFIRYGADELRDPHPLFKTRFYCNAFLKYQNSADRPNPLIHYLLIGYKNNMSPSLSFDLLKFYQEYPDALKNDMEPITYLEEKGIIIRSGEHIKVDNDLKRQMLKASFLEPMIPQAYDMNFSNAITRYIYTSDIILAFRICMKILGEKPTHVIIFPWICYGGADWEQVCHVNALASIPENKIAVITTQTDNVEAASWINNFNNNVKIVNIPLQLKENLLESVDKVELLKMILNHCGAGIIHISNSLTGFQVLRRYGMFLSNFSKLYSSVYCHDYSADLLISDYPSSHLRWCLPYLTGVFTDNRTFIKVLRNEYGLTSRDIKKFIPINYEIRDLKGNEGKFLKKNLSNNKILWAGRIAKQKRPDVLLKVIKKLPEFEFHIFGSGADEKDFFKEVSLLKNVKCRGTYESFAELIQEDFFCFLYTSSWDGLPNVLLEAALAGLPIVAPDIGGISEIINDNTGYLIKSSDDIEGYEKALLSIKANTAHAKEKALNAYEYVIENHTKEKFFLALKQNNYI